MSLRASRTSIVKVGLLPRVVVIVRREIVLAAGIAVDAAAVVDVTAAAVVEDAGEVDAADVPVVADAAVRGAEDGTKFFATDLHGYARI